MPVINCPYPACTFVTDDIPHDLAGTILQIHASDQHKAPSTSHTHAAVAKVEKVRRPTIASVGNSEELSYFLTRWQDYVDATKITGRDKVIQLLECCSEDLGKDLTRTAGGSLTNKTEKTVLDAIKALAVREENTMVARVALYEMKQERDEPIRSFGARIRGQAGICKYLMDCPTCTNEVNYTNTILRDVTVMGIADPDIQLDLLSDKNQNMTLEEIFQFVDAKEAGKRSASKLSHHSTESIRSSYRKQQTTKPPMPTETCSYCGNQGHGRNLPIQSRKNVCQMGKSVTHAPDSTTSQPCAVAEWTK